MCLTLRKEQIGSVDTAEMFANSIAGCRITAHKRNNIKVEVGITHIYSKHRPNNEQKLSQEID
jgi:hypothetical protein